MTHQKRADLGATTKHVVSRLTVTKMDEDGDERIIEGIASTPNEDRHGDIVLAEGAKYALPLPLLWQHDHGQPIGEVEFAEVTSRGIRFRARLKMSDRPGKTKDRLDEAWEHVRLGLTKFVSIGFRASKYAFTDEGGIEFQEWEWLELSVVTIPANAEATIDQVRSFQTKLLAAPGDKAAKSDSSKAAVAARSIPLSKGNGTMSYKEQRNALQKTLEAKEGRLDEILADVAKSGVTKTEEQKAEFDQLKADIKSLEEDISDLDDMIARDEAKSAKSAAAAKAVDTPTTRTPVALAAQPVRQEDKGLNFARAALCIAKGGNAFGAEQIAERFYENNDEVRGFLKAAVGAQGTQSPGPGGSISEAQTLQNEYLDVLYPQTIIGRLAAGNAAPRTVPFNVKVPRGVNGGSAAFVGENKPIPVSQHQFDTVTVEHFKLGALAVLPKELIMLGNIDAERAVRDQMMGAAIQTMDTAFIDAANAGTAGVKPASIINGIAAIAASGTDADAVAKDRVALSRAITSTNLSAAGIVLIMGETLAGDISAFRTALGQDEYPDLTEEGGTLKGRRVLTSNVVADGAIIALHVPSLLLARSPDVMFEQSTEASLEMNDAPTQDGTTGTGAALYSLFQNDGVGIKATHSVNWKLGYASAAAYIADAAYGTEAPAGT